jgi:hypothetical protein
MAVNPNQVWKLTTPAERVFVLALPVGIVLGFGVVAASNPDPVQRVFLWVGVSVLAALLVGYVRGLWLLAARRVQPRPLLPLDPARNWTVDVTCRVAQRPHRWRWVPGVGWMEIDHPEGKCAC